MPKNIQTKVTSLAFDKQDFTQFDKHLTIAFLKEIVLENWDLFKEEFTINADEKNSKEKKIKWLSEFIKIRSNYSHVGGVITKENIEYLNNILGKFKENISKYN